MYSEKFNKSILNTVYNSLPEYEKEIVKQIAFAYNLSFQDLKILCEITKDLTMWNDSYICKIYSEFNIAFPILKNPKVQKREFIDKIKQYYENKKFDEKEYNYSSSIEVTTENLKCIPQNIDTNIFGDCPVYSEKTICCGLKTLDAVQNCPFNCSYCTIQTFYGDDYIFVKNLKEKLSSLNLDKDKFYHIGTGQSSDALVWGNKFNILDRLMEFAKNNPNILLELKTKSSNIEYFMNTNIPKNVVCSWTINTQKVIDNEELGTASLKDRLNSALKLSKLNIKVAFHFHPIIFYKGWEKEYSDIIDYIQNNFSPDTISFISFGSLTFIKPVIKQIRDKKIKTKILQMPTALDPNGKITYPDELKITLYKTLYQKFNKFHNKTYFYLCMETRKIWESVFGTCYIDNEAFLKDFKVKTLDRFLY